jgi:putative heme-binding domain-containing protein
VPRRVRSSFGQWWIAGACLLVWGPVAAAQSNATVIPPVDPELERASFVVPEGFEVNLFAGDPSIAKPIQINFDPQGRLWLVSSEVYPQVKPGEKPTDKVLVLEDTDGDGVSDETHVFAEGLLIPTGVAPGDGGAYVGASTELLHFADDDGDLKADRMRVVLSGFGTEDTHHILHTLRWGPEQRLYMSQSIYIHSHVETPWGVRRLNAGGIWQFRPDTLQLEVFMRGLVNSWGTAFDDYGTTFATDGAGGEGINYIVPGASYVTAYGAARILPGLNPGSPKHCGLEIVSAESLPEDWQGSCIASDFRGHRVCRFVLSPDGAGFLSREQQEVIRSDHQSFRPIDAKIGPDGAIYIADWYNPIIQHGEVDFRDERRDHVHGRIWRVAYTGKPKVERPNLVEATNVELLAHMESPNIWTRDQAKRVLKERGPSVLADVRTWMRQLDNTREDYHRLRLEALWLHLAHDTPEPELLESLLVCRDANARAAATRVIGDWLDRLPNALALLDARVRDDHGRVRLEAVRVLSKLRQPAAIEVAARSLAQPTERAYAEELNNAPLPPDPFVFDRWLDYALWQTSRELQPVWQPALLSGAIDFDGQAAQLAFVLKSAGSPETVPVLVSQLQKGQVSEPDVPAVLSAIAEFGRPEDLQSLLSLVTGSSDAGRSTQYLDALASAFRQRQTRPAGSIAPLLESTGSAAAPVQAGTARLIGLWQAREGYDWLAQAAIAEGDAGVRVAATRALADFGGDAALNQLEQLAQAGTELDVRRAAIEGLLAGRPDQGVALGAQFLVDNGSAEATARLLAAVVSRPEAAQQLAAELERRSAENIRIPADAAVLGLRAIRSSGQRFEALEQALAKAGGVSSEPKVLSVEEMRALVEQVAAQGDPHRGEVIYRRQELACQACHAVGDAGGLVGPNLISLGATAQLDYLLQSLLDPNAKVKEGYHTVVVVDDDGQQWAGIKLRQTDDAVLLRDKDGKELSIPLSKIEAESPGISLMPAGLTEKLTGQELADLTAFLSGLGRLPDFTVGQQAVARRWEVLEATPEAADHIRRTSYGRATRDEPQFRWQRLYSRVDGSLPLDELPELEARWKNANVTRGASFVRCEIEVAKGGPLLLKFHGAEGLAAWVGAEPISVQGETAVTLPTGRHRLTISIERKERAEPLRLEIGPAAGSDASATFVGGV